MTYPAVLTFALAYAAFSYGGVTPVAWNLCLLILGGLAIASSLRLFGAPHGPFLPRGLRWPLVLPLLYVGLQIVPLPLDVLKILSPMQARALAAVQDAADGAPFGVLSALPAATLESLMLWVACLVVFLLIRQLVTHGTARPWQAVAPVLLVAALQAALGVAQLFAGDARTLATGAYVNRNHFSAFLGVALPLALMYPFAALRADSSRPVRAALRSSVVVVLAALMLTGILLSQSRMGFLATLCSLIVMAAVGLRLLLRRLAIHRLGRAAPALAAAALGLAGFFYLPSNSLIARYARLPSPEAIQADTRWRLWEETARLIQDYPLLGCGLGAFEAAISRYRRTVPMRRADYAHSDYLQLAAELGLIGFSLLAWLVAAVVVAALRATSTHPSAAARALGLACLGSFASFLLHSLADFPSYIPANLMALAWIAGIAAGLAATARHSATARPQRPAAPSPLPQANRTARIKFQ